MEDSTSPGRVPLIHDTAYYSDTVSFLVEHCLFKIARNRLVFSSEAFSVTHGLKDDVWNSKSPGYCDDNPIIIPEVSADEFRALLRHIFPPSSDGQKSSLSKNEWLCTLKIATLLEFNDIRRLAVKALEGWVQTESALEQISLAKDFHVSSWLISGFQSLVTQSTSITESQALEIGPMIAVRLYIIRESYRRSLSAPVSAPKTSTSKLSSISSPSQSQPVYSVNGNVNRMFSEEIQEIRDQERKYPTNSERKIEESRLAKEAREQEVARLKASIEEGKKKLAEEEAAINKQEVGRGSA